MLLIALIIFGITLVPGIIIWNKVVKFLCNLSLTKVFSVIIWVTMVYMLDLMIESAHSIKFFAETLENSSDKTGLLDETFSISFYLACFYQIVLFILFFCVSFPHLFDKWLRPVGEEMRAGYWNLKPFVPFCEFLVSHWMSWPCPACSILKRYELMASLWLMSRCAWIYSPDETRSSWLIVRLHSFWIIEISDLDCLCLSSSLWWHHWVKEPLHCWD